MQRVPGLILLSALVGVGEVLAQGIYPAAPVASEGSASRIVNLSTRARVTATNPLISGFAIAGVGSRPVLVRAAGPSLSAFGVTGTLTAPRLELRDAAGTIVATNAGWADSSALSNSFAQAGAFPFAPGSADAAAVVTLAPGTYTVQISDPSGAGGVALAEIYDLGDASGNARLVNVSSRSTVSAGGGELISGFVIDGNAEQQFLLRGVGPGLSRLGVSGVLTDPTIAIFDSAGRLKATNDNWSGLLNVVQAVVSAGTSAPIATATTGTTYFPPLNDQIASATAATAPVTTAAGSVGAFGLELFSKDAATLVTLSPGAYTVQVKGFVSSDTATVATDAQFAAQAASSTTGTSGAVSVTAASVAAAAAAAAAVSAAVPTPIPSAVGVALLEIYEVR